MVFFLHGITRRKRLIVGLHSNRPAACARTLQCAAQATAPFSSRVEQGSPATLADPAFTHLSSNRTVIQAQLRSAAELHRSAHHIVLFLAALTNRLGHMSEKGMKVMLSKEKLSGFQLLDLDFCEDCVLGKQKKDSFTKLARILTTEKLELIYNDVWGLSKSHGGRR